MEAFYAGNKKPPKARCTALGGCKKDATVRRNLTLGELEALAGAGLTGLLTLASARVTLHVTLFLKIRAKLAVEFLKGTGNTEAGGSGLTIEAAAVSFDGDINLLGHIDGLKGGECRPRKLFGLEVAFGILAVDLEFAISSGEADACDRSLAAADSYKCFFAHYIKGLNR